MFTVNLKKKTAQFIFTLRQFFFLQNWTRHKLTPNLVGHKSSDYVLEIAYACERSNNIIYYYIVCDSIFSLCRNLLCAFSVVYKLFDRVFFFDPIAKIFTRHNSLSVLIYGQRFFPLQRLGVRKGKKNSVCRLYYIPITL